ncbi:hypothetical protein K469DRAFT_601007, partial [Zopfia rhizophila CBS 207.26]
MTATHATSLAPFQKALDEFCSDLSPDDRDEISCTSLQELQKCILEIQQKHYSARKVTNMVRLRAFLEAMEQYGKVIEVFLNTTNFLAFVWTASTFVEAFEELMDMYNDIGESLPLVLQYESLFHGTEFPHMRQILEHLYLDVLKFHHAAYKYFKQRMWKQLFHATWKTFRSRFQPILDDLRRHKSLIETQANLYQFQEVQRIKATTETEFHQLRDAEDLRRKNMVLDWLSAASVQEDQEMRSSARIEYPGVCKWILDHPNFLTWRDSPNSNPFVWVTGMPGSASFIIEKLHESTPSDSQVLFFYCKHEDADRNSYLAVARALIGQIVTQHSTILSYVYEEVSKSGEKPLKTMNRSQKILDIAIRNLNNVYIIIDGLDECLPGEKRVIASWFRGLTQSANDDGINLRCLFSSQSDQETSKALKGLPLIHLDSSTLLADLEIFCNVEAEKIKTKFDLTDTEKRQIIEKVLNEAGGMFLYAKLVMNNLLAQTRLVNLRRELEPGRFPKSIGEAYDRITERILDPRSSQRDDAKQLLGLLICAKRSVKWHEIQGAVSIDSERKTVDFDGRSFRVDSKALGGSLIEIRPNGVVELVHMTAREYAYLSLEREEIALARLCLNYLTMDCFNRGLDEQLLQAFVTKGHYAFAEYAIVHWSDHLLAAIGYETIDKSQLDSLAKTVETFLATHFSAKQSSKWAPESVRESAHVFKSQLFFQQLVQAIALLRIRRDPDSKDKQKDQIPEKKENNLDLEQTLSEVRSAIVKISNRLQTDRYRLETYYGLKIYKCSQIDCTSFVEGFSDPEHFSEHVERHSHRYFCTIEGCTSGMKGFSSELRLWQHHKRFHDINTGPEFPSFDE